MNSIPQVQNLPEQLEQLAAQRWLYTRAKKAFAFELLVSIAVPIILGIVVIYFPSLKPISAVMGFVTFIVVNIALLPYQRHVRALAAQIQEKFDCKVLQMDWNPVVISNKPEQDVIIRSANNILKGKTGVDHAYLNLIDWYPTKAGDLPIQLARIICQRANCRWDSHLRRRYSYLVIIVTGFGILIAILYAVQQGMRADSFVMTVLVMLPLISLGIRQFQDNTRAANSLDRLKGIADNLLEDGIKNPIAIAELEKKSRTFQDEIYRNRKDNPLIFDWIYERLKRGQEEEMQLSASKQVEDILLKIKHP